MKRDDTTPNPVYRPGRVVVATGLMLAAVLTFLVAVANPVAVAGAVAAAAVATVGTTLALDYRRKVGRTRQVCVPKTGVCVEA